VEEQASEVRDIRLVGGAGDHVGDADTEVELPAGRFSDRDEGARLPVDEKVDGTQ